MRCVGTRRLASLLGALLAVAMATGCTGSKHAATRPPAEPSPTSAGYASAVSAVRGSCGAVTIMFNGRNLPTHAGTSTPGVRRIGWQSADQPVGFGWIAEVQHENDGYTVMDCKAQSINHG